MILATYRWSPEPSVDENPILIIEAESELLERLLGTIQRSIDKIDFLIGVYGRGEPLESIGVECTSKLESIKEWVSNLVIHESNENHSAL